MVRAGPLPVRKERRPGAAEQPGTSIKGRWARPSPTARLGSKGRRWGRAAPRPAAKSPAARPSRDREETSTPTAHVGRPRHCRGAGRRRCAARVRVSPDSAVAGGMASGAYGTHAFSPTYCHAQGIAGQRWCDGCRCFTPAWCGVHPWAWCPAGYAAAAWATAAWRPATWPAVGSWLAWNATPGYYDYGSNITYQNNYVYYGTQPVETQQQYYQQAVNLAGSDASVAASNTTAAAGSGTEAQWLPLGVFGLMAEGQQTPEMVFQLAIDKAGAIRGNYYDQVSDATAPVTGALDKKDQRVAWRVGANKNLVIETGLYNLTQDHSTALVHYGPDQTQQYVLVRIKQPDRQNRRSGRSEGRRSWPPYLLT